MSDHLDPANLPDTIADIDALEELMSRPSAALIEDLAAVEGDILILGIGGKMGPSLARLAKRAAPEKRVVGVARFSEPGLEEALQAHGIETIKADLLDRNQVEALPKLENVIFMAGRKFGSSGAEELTWAMNVHVPALVAEAFAASRIVAFSTACVYPFANVLSLGCSEDVDPTPPPGDYANSCVGRERMFDYFSKAHGTPGRIIRLSYAIDMRYGVLYDVASKVWGSHPVDVTMGHANVIWQGDANAQVLRSLRHCTTPTSALNVSGPEKVSIRDLARVFAARFDRETAITGTESTSAWLIDCTAAQRLFGYPQVPLGKLIDWTADWVARGGKSLGKPTHFETRDGNY